MNLLKFIKDDEKHILNKFLNITDDYTSIISKLDNKKRKIYCDGNRVNLEDLGREIFISMESRIYNYIKQYNIEFNTGNNERADLVSTNYKFLNNVIEFKNVNSLTKNMDKHLEQAFIQVKNYIIDLSKIHLKTKNTFGVVVLLDIEKIIKKPSLLDKYNNSINYNLLGNIKKSIDLFGIYIESRIFSLEKLNYENNKVKNHIIPVNEIFDINELDDKENLLSNISRYTRNAIDAKNTITSTPNLGISNVRMRLTLENKNKYNMLLDFMETIIEGYNNNNIYYLNIFSETKTYIYNKQNSIINLYNNKIMINSCDSATINGQQSTEIPYLIHYLINNNFNKDTLNYKIKKDLLDKLEDTSSSNIRDFSIYLNKLSFNYSLIQTKDRNCAKKITYTKNNSISVEKEDAFFINNSSKIRFLSNEMHEKLELLLIYPNVHNKFTNKYNEINMNIPISLYDFINKSNFKKKSFIKVFILSKKNNKFIFNQKIEKIVDGLVKNSDLKNDTLIKIDNKIKEIEKKIIFINNFIDTLLKYQKNNNEEKDLKKDIKNNEEIKEKEINNIKRLKKERIIYNEGYFIDKKNLDILKNIKNLWNNIEIQFDNYNPPKEFRLIKSASITWCHIILGFLLKRNNINNINDFYNINNFNELNNDVSKIINSLSNIFKYNFIITSVNNKKEDELKSIYINNGIKQKSIYDLFEDEFSLI